MVASNGNGPLRKWPCHRSKWLLLHTTARGDFLRNTAPEANSSYLAPPYAHRACLILSVALAEVFPSSPFARPGDSELACSWGPGLAPRSAFLCSEHFQHPAQRSLKINQLIQMKELENIKNFSLFKNSKITWKNILKYYVTYSEVKEQCLCLAASVLEAPCLSPPSVSQMPEVAQTGHVPPAQKQKSEAREAAGPPPPDTRDFCPLLARCGSARLHQGHFPNCQR